MILHRIQPCLDNHQPEEQHGFRAGRRLEEHLLTANLFLDKTLAANMPVWILSLDLSKAFDRVDWGALWSALSEHGVSSHMLWKIENLYFNQHGEVTGQGGNGALFKSTQVCDKDACLVRKCFLQYFVGQCQGCEHVRKVVRLDLILVMACHLFWI